MIFTILRAFTNFTKLGYSLWFPVQLKYTSKEQCHIGHNIVSVVCSTWCLVLYPTWCSPQSSCIQKRASARIWCIPGFCLKAGRAAALWSGAAGRLGMLSVGRFALLPYPLGEAKNMCYFACRHFCLLQSACSLRAAAKNA